MTKSVKNLDSKALAALRPTAHLMLKLWLFLKRHNVKYITDYATSPLHKILRTSSDLDLGSVMLLHSKSFIFSQNMSLQELIYKAIHLNRFREKLFITRDVEPADT